MQSGRTSPAVSRLPVPGAWEELTRTLDSFAEWHESDHAREWRENLPDNDDANSVAYWDNRRPLARVLERFRALDGRKPALFALGEMHERRIRPRNPIALSNSTQRSQTLRECIPPRLDVEFLHSCRELAFPPSVVEWIQRLLDLDDLDDADEGLSAAVPLGIAGYDINGENVLQPTPEFANLIVDEDRRTIRRAGAPVAVDLSGKPTQWHIARLLYCARGEKVSLTKLAAGYPGGPPSSDTLRQAIHETRASLENHVQISDGKKDRGGHRMLPLSDEDLV